MALISLTGQELSDFLDEKWTEINGTLLLPNMEMDYVNPKIVINFYADIGSGDYGNEESIYKPYNVTVKYTPQKEE